MLLIGTNVKTIKRGRGRTNDHLVELEGGKRVEVSRLFYQPKDDGQDRECEESTQHQQCGGGRRIIRKRIGGA